MKSASVSASTFRCGTGTTQLRARRTRFFPGWCKRQSQAPKEPTPSNRLFGAIDGVRTRDIQDHNLALYQLSYDRREVLCLHDSRRGRKAMLYPERSTGQAPDPVVILPSDVADSDLDVHLHLNHAGPRYQFLIEAVQRIRAGEA
jgi:hypothetical protein